MGYSFLVYLANYYYCIKLEFKCNTATSYGYEKSHETRKKTVYDNEIYEGNKVAIHFSFWMIHFALGKNSQRSEINCTFSDDKRKLQRCYIHM